MNMSTELQSLHDKNTQDSNMSLIEYLNEAESAYIESIKRNTQKDDEFWKPIYGTGYVALRPDKLLDSITYLKQKGRIRPNMNFLDPGCGLAINDVIAAQ